MTDKDNPLKSAELSTEQNTNMIDGIINNAPPILPPEPVPAIPPLEKVKEPQSKKRSREREER